MKRKVARIGPSTLMISLPSKWCKENNIQKGAELELSLDHQEIILSKKERTPETKEISLDLSKFRHFPRHLVISAYKCGYDLVKANFTSSSDKNDVTDLLTHTGLGYSIIDESKNQIIIKDIATLNTADFEASFRKSIFIMNEIAKTTLTLAETRQGKYLTEIILLHRNINRYTDICRRIMSKNKIEWKYPSNVYLIIQHIVSITKCYEYFCLALMGKEITNQPFQKEVYDYSYLKSKPLRKELKEWIARINHLVAQWGDIIFSPSLEKIDHFTEDVLQASAEMEQFSYSVSKQEILLFAILFNILTYLRLPRDLFLPLTM